MFQNWSGEWYSNPHSTSSRASPVGVPGRVFAYNLPVKYRVLFILSYGDRVNSIVGQDLPLITVQRRRADCGQSKIEVWFDPRVMWNPVRFELYLGAPECGDVW
jgi:hypothetical protein